MKPPHTPRSGQPGNGKGATRTPTRGGGPGRPQRPDRAGATDQRGPEQKRGAGPKWGKDAPRDARPPRNAVTPQHRAEPAATRPRTGGTRLELPRAAEHAKPGEHAKFGEHVKPGEHAREAPHARPARPGADTPRGTVWLYGIHAVAAALANPNRRLRRLMLTQEAEAAIAGRLPPPWATTSERADRARIDQLLGRDIVHQGAALLADLLAPPALGRVLERSGPVIVLDQVTDSRNVGAILRSAAAFGAAAVITQDRNSPEENGALAKAASGALETMPLLRAVNIARTLVALKAAGCWVVGLDSGRNDLSGPALAQRRVALVLGNEGDGLRRLTRDTCDEVAGIGMPGRGGGLDSLNVATAAAVALYELGRTG